MRKTMSTDPTTKVRRIRTRNGVDTKTQPFYVKKIHHFTPRPDGYNEELAEYVYAQIEANQALWNQGVWRQLITVDNLDDQRYLYAQAHDLNSSEVNIGEMQKDLQLAMAVKADMDNPICGTAMCCAGWVTEVMATDFMVDLEMARWAYANGHDVDTHMDTVLVPISTLKRLREERLAGSGVYVPNSQHLKWMLEATMHSALSDGVLELLAKRGFTPETHEGTTVASWATYCLGLEGVEGGGDVPLFAAGNDLTKIRMYLDNYARLGPGAHYLGDEDDDDESDEDD